MVNHKPDFLGLGAQKAASTWLHHCLKLHPHIYLPEHLKEIQFWNKSERKAKGLEWYENFFRFAPAQTIKGEITPNYGGLSSDIIAEIFAYQPALKLIYILRNPMDRAWSNVRMQMRHQGLDPQTCSLQWYENQLTNKHTIHLGDYATHLENWFSFFSKKQMLLIPFEDVKEQPLAVLKKTCTHIDVDPRYYDTVPPAKLLTPVKKEPAQISPEIHAKFHPLLQEIYTPKIEALSTFLGRDFNGWLDA
ncbi:MAG: sulfotransferase domain-containing protein [Alphaproteobacteria bacterium]